MVLSVCFVELAASLVLAFLLFSSSGVVGVVVNFLLVLAAAFLFVVVVAPFEFMVAVAFSLFVVVASSLFGGGVPF